jgi:hypothetical protein
MWAKHGRDGEATDGNIMRQMPIACWLPKTTNTHSEYVILITFARQQRLRERALMLRLYTHPLSYLNICSAYFQSSVLYTADPNY